MPLITYVIEPFDPKAHIFQISMRLEHPSPQQAFFLPAWVPGSYMIRDFSRHILSIQCTSEGLPIPLAKLDKQAWMVTEPVSGSLVVSYRIYACDLSVRGSYLDDKSGFFNGASVFLCPVGHESAPVEIKIHSSLPACSTWKVGTTLRSIKVNSAGLGNYGADNYDELIDHPVQWGEFQRLSFEVLKVPHEVILTGQHRCDTARFTKDIIRICQYHMQFFGMPIPIDRYAFLMQVTGNGYGGLEHRNSAALYISREALPVIGEEQAKEDYVNLLGLISHEYFHTWNVKRIKPAVFSPYELRRENYTRELWLYEGVTSYYDDLALLRCKLISLKTWCDIVSKTINRVLSGPGRLIQSVSEASFDAWIKFYRQDENAVNSQVSYYAKGALVAFALDMVLRHETQGEKSLDHLMRQLWQQYGSINRPLIEGEVEVLASGLCGKDLSYFFNQYIRGTEDLPLGDFVTQFGLMLKEDLPKKSALGVRFENNSLKIASVLTGSCAHESGLSAGDEIVSINQLRIPVNYFSRHIESYLPDSVITVHAFRNDELRVFEVKLKPLPYSNWSLLIDESVIDEKVISQRKAWMEGIPPN